MRCTRRCHCLLAMESNCSTTIRSHHWKATALMIMQRCISTRQRWRITPYANYRKFLCGSYSPSISAAYGEQLSHFHLSHISTIPYIFFWKMSRFAAAILLLADMPSATLSNREAYEARTTSSGCFHAIRIAACHTVCSADRFVGSRRGQQQNGCFTADRRNHYGAGKAAAIDPGQKPPLPN